MEAELSESVSYTGEFKQEWAIHAKRRGSQTDLRAMQATFGICDSYEKALARVEKFLRVDPANRQKWAGWSFYPVLVSHSVRSNEQGVVSVAKGDRKIVMVR